MHHPARARWVDHIADAAARRRPLALLFDFDGTLAPIARHPDLAAVSDRTRTAVARLHELPGLSVGVVSGRMLADVRPRVGLPLPHFAGSGGLELQVAGELRAFPVSAAQRAALDAIPHALQPTLHRFPGTWVERKPSTLTVHFRELPHADGVAFFGDVAGVLNGFPDVRFREVSEAVEVSPADGWHKGTAVDVIVRHVREETGHDPLAAYFGDAANDDEAMAAVQALGGVTVGVGPTPPPADFHTPDPHSLTAELEWLLAVITCPSRAGVPPVGLG